MNPKKVSDIYLKGPVQEFTFGQIRQGTKRASSPNGKDKKVITYMISREGIDDSDLKKIKKRIKQLGEVDHSMIIIPEKVIVTSNKLYFVFPLGKENPFDESYKERKIKVPRFFQKITDCVKHLKDKGILPMEVQPQTLRFDHRGNFEWHELNCDFLLKKKFFTNRMKELRKSDLVRVHAPEVINPSEVRQLDPEKSLTYSLGMIFDGVAEQRENADEPDVLTKRCQDFIEKMRNKVSSERPDLNEVLNFKWSKTSTKSVSFEDGTKEDGDSGSKRKWDEKRQDLKRGKFTPEEVEALKHSMCRYVKQTGMGEDGLMKLITHYKDQDVRGAWTIITECLPNRSVNSCHQMIRNRFHPDNYKGAWTAEEEKKLKELVEEKGTKWTAISEELRRTPTNVKDKWKEMGADHHEDRDKTWKAEEVAKLFRVIEGMTRTKLLSENAEEWIEEERQARLSGNGDPAERDIYEKRKKRDQVTKLLQSNLCNFIDYEEAKKLKDVSIEWMKVAQKMKTKSSDDCRRLWWHQIYNTIGTGTEFTEEEDGILIEGILEQDAMYEKDINFNEIDNGRSAYENQMRWKQLARAATSKVQRSTSETVKHVKKYVRELRSNQSKAFHSVNSKEKNMNHLLSFFKERYGE